MSDAFDLDELLPNNAPRPKRGRPTKEEAAARLEAMSAQALPHYTAFRAPVNITFLANILGVQPRQIQRRLEKCPIQEMTKGSSKPQPLYNFLEAMAYLIPPQGSIEDWLAQQNQASLPPAVSKFYWEMVNSRIRAMRQAGELWHDSEVLLTFARVAMLIRQESKMWVEDMPGRHKLTDEQYNFLVDRVNDMNSQIRAKLEQFPREHQTYAHAHRIETELEGTDRRPMVGADE